MTQDEIIEMAKRVGFEEHQAKFDTRFEPFAKLVAEKVNADWSETNERLIKVFNEKADLAYLSGAKEEREACAKLCEDSVEYAGGTLAEAIRARGQA
jgi:hypothetical protein